MSAVKATRSTGSSVSGRRQGITGIAVGMSGLLAIGSGLGWLRYAPEPVTLPGVTVIGPDCRRDVYVREYVPSDGGTPGETWIYSLRARKPVSWQQAASQSTTQPTASVSTTALARGRLLWAGAGFTVLLR